MKSKTIDEIKKGFYWHCHHDILCEFVYDFEERKNYILKNKPKKEIKTRLKLFKKVKGKLAKKWTEAWEKWDEARKKCDEAWEKYDEAWEKWVEAWEKCDEAGKKRVEAEKKCVEAREKWVEATEKYKTQTEKLHKKECGCSEWNGKEIVFQ